MQLAGAGLHSRPVTAAVHSSAQLHNSASARSAPHCFKAAACRRAWPTYRKTSRRPQHVVCQAATDLAKFANQAYLDKAAQRFRLGKTLTPPAAACRGHHSLTATVPLHILFCCEGSTPCHTSGQRRNVWPFAAEVVMCHESQ